MASTRRLTLALLVCASAANLTAQRTPDEALRALQEGNRRFVAERSLPQPLGEGVRRTLARGQSPFAIVLCCGDSRVPPEHVFNTGLGELFVVRVAGHTCDPETLASIEYAVEHLNTPLCVVLGHEGCGAIAGAVAQAGGADTSGTTGAMRHLFENIEPAVRRARARDLGGKALCDAAEEEHVHETVHECLRRSDLLRRYASVGRFRMVPARYHLASGEVEWLPRRPLPTATAGEPAVAHAVVPASVPPHVALRLLQAGHRRFLGDGQPTGDVGRQRREALATGQQPIAIVLTCADSRVAPEHVFDSGLGDLFVIRVAGNALTDNVLASIEYAAAHTGASLLVVMGHTRCSAVQAASEQPENNAMSSHLRTLITRLEPSVAAARASGGRGDVVDLAVRANVLRTAAEVRSRSSLLQRLEDEGRFATLPALYEIATGDLTWLKDGGAGEAPAAAPAGETHAAPEHGRASAGAEPQPPRAPRGPEAERTPAPPAGHGRDAMRPVAAASAAHVAHGEPHAHEARPDPSEPRPEWWRDLRHLIGLIGVVSMSAAALLVLKKRD